MLVYDDKLQVSLVESHENNWQIHWHALRRKQLHEEKHLQLRSESQWRHG